MAELRPIIVFQGRHFVHHLGICNPIYFKLLQIMSGVISRKFKKRHLYLKPFSWGPLTRNTYTHTHHTHTHTNTHTHTHTHAHAHAHAHTHTHTHTHPHIHTHTHTTHIQTDRHRHTHTHTTIAYGELQCVAFFA